MANAGTEIDLCRHLTHNTICHFIYLANTINLYIHFLPCFHIKVITGFSRFSPRNASIKLTSIKITPPQPNQSSSTLHMLCIIP